MILQNIQTKNLKIELKDIRQPAYAGQFYPADPRELDSMLTDYFRQAERSTVAGIPRILLAPHAGYIFSGQTAAYSFKQLMGSGYKRAIVIGRSHNAYFHGVSADTHLAWTTPLGQLAVDQDFIHLLESATSSLIISDDIPHNNEHSLEVMMPFLIKALGDGVKIVPLLFGDEDAATSLKLAEVLEPLIDQETLVIISSDLSHYPAYKDANDLDQKTIEAILSCDVEKFQQKVRELEQLGRAGVATLACAEPAISAGLILAENLGLKPYLLKYTNSGDVMPESKDRVVGYAAIAFGQQPTANNQPSTIKGQQPIELNFDEQEIALQIARKTMEAAFENREYQPQLDGFPIFQSKRGAFVTLKENGQLRGCIGTFEENKPLAEVIRQMALAAAFQDLRFSPLTRKELPLIEIEISVLSPREKIINPDLIEVGKHGVYMQRGSRGGVYLPQVAVEQGWSKEEFLESLCEQKAGIGKNCWRDPAVDLYIFTAHVFHE